MYKHRYLYVKLNLTTHCYVKRDLPFLMDLTKSAWDAEAIVFTKQVVFVRAAAKALASGEEGNMAVKRDPAWSAAAKGMLCSSRKLANSI